MKIATIPLRSSLTLISLIISTRGMFSDFPVLFGSQKDICAITLNLSSVGFAQIRKNFIINPSIQQLILEDNDIVEISEGAFDGLPKLLILDLSRNRLPPTEFFTFGGLAHLISLQLDYNHDSSRQSGAVEVKYPLPELEYLSMRDCQIQSLSSTWTSNLPVLTHLDLSENPLVSEDVAPHLPHTLTHLYIEKATITSFCANGLVNLRSLTLDGNQFEAIGNSDECNEGTLNLYYPDPGSHLLELSVIDCRIMDIEDEAFQHVPHLRVLNLQSNPIRRISGEALLGLKSLRELDVSQTPLEEIPNFSKSQDLTYLYMNEMRNVSIFEQIQASNLQIKTLKLLSLEGNSIQSISEDALNGMPMLETVYLSRNKLKQFSVTWNAGKLKAIYLDDNSLVNLNDVVLSGATDLKLLEISRNRIHRFNVSHLQTYSSLATIEYVPLCG